MPTDWKQGLGLVVGFWLSLALLLPMVTSTARGETLAAPPFQTLEEALHEQVNAARRQRHLIALRRDPALDRVARAHSEDMARRGYLAHESPEGQNPMHRLARAGVEGFRLAAENIGQSSESQPNRAVLTGWIQSTVHRENLTAPAFNTTGIGIARAADGSFIYTQLYLTYPREANPPRTPSR
ncbi:MAG: CAP domain-containing protein [Proteobacteria bacterium]|nr:CAP domain-containing protein [Pseudomonadota bacterium]